MVVTLCSLIFGKNLFDWLENSSIDIFFEKLVKIEKSDFFELFQGAFLLIVVDKSGYIILVSDCV